MPFLLSFFLSLLIGFVVWYPNRYEKSELKVREGFLIVVLFWTVLGAVGALPFWLAEQPDMNLAASMFESFSGLTTTGATVLTGFKVYPKLFCIIASRCNGLAAWGS